VPQTHEGENISMFNTDTECQVLIVDDDMFNLEILKNLLNIKYSVQSRQACSGNIAIDMVMERIFEFKRTNKSKLRHQRDSEHP